MAHLGASPDRAVRQWVTSTAPQHGLTNISLLLDGKHVVRMRTHDTHARRQAGRHGARGARKYPHEAPTRMRAIAAARRRSAQSTAPQAQPAGL